MSWHCTVQYVRLLYAPLEARARSPEMFSGFRAVEAKRLDSKLSVVCTRLIRHGRPIAFHVC